MLHQSTLDPNKTDVNNLRKLIMGTPNHLVLLTHQRHPSRKRRNTNIHAIAPLERLAMLLSFAGKEKTITDKLYNDAINYANDNLNRIGTGNSYTVSEANVGKTSTIAPERTNISPLRAVAINLLLEVIKTSSAIDIYQYVTTPHFQHLLGGNEIKMNIFRTHLSTIIQYFIHSYEAFLEISANDVLIDTLTHPSVVNTITDNDLKLLFQYYNPKLIADLFVNYYPNTNFFSRFNKNSFNVKFIHGLLSDDPIVIKKINYERSKARASLLLPTDAVSPGKNSLRDESLSPYQLYQYEDETIFAVENWLLNKFSSVLINRVSDQKFSKERLNPQTPYYFYLISSAEYMLLSHDTNSSLKPRYKKFRRDIRSLIKSQDPAQSIIYCGIININGVHYLPYFIKSNLNKIQVFTIDPSARTYPFHAITKGKEDHKLIIQKNLKQIFNDIFPDCEFHDPDVAQMLRERDCGPNAATTLMDAFTTCTTSSPLFQFNGTGKLAIDSHQLSVQFQPIGTNPYTNMYVYSAKLDEASLANRDQWKIRLSSTQMVYPLTIRANCDENKPFSIYDAYIIAEQLSTEFNYDNSVKKQLQHDKHQLSLSSIRTLLIATPEGNALTTSLLQSYHNDLKLPSSAPLIHFIQENVSPVELEALTQAHGGSLTILADNCIVLLLKDHVPSAFIQCFKNKILNNLPDIDSLDANVLVTNFLQEHAHIYSYLSIYQQREIHEIMLTHANEVVTIKFISSYMEKVNRHFYKHVLSYLASSHATQNNPEAHLIIAEMLADKEIQEEVKYLLIHDGASLESFIHSNLPDIIGIFSDETVQYFKENFDILFPHLNDLIDLFSVDSLDYIPFTADRLSVYLPSHHPRVLCASQAKSQLGNMILDDINQTIYDLAIQRLNPLTKTRVHKFLAQDEVIKALIANQDVAALTEQVYHDSEFPLQNLVIPDISFLITQYGNPQTITENSFYHPLINHYLNEALQIGITAIYRQALFNKYEQLNTYLLSQCENVFVYEDYVANQVVLSDLLNYLIKNSSGSSAFIGDLLVDNPAEKPTKLHFVQWFTVNTQTVVENQASQLGFIMQNATNMHALLKQMTDRLNQQNMGHKADEIAFYQNKVAHLITEINHTHVIHQFDANLLTLKSTLGQMIIDSAKLIMSKAYRTGEVKPGTYTALVRPSLCQLLGIKAPHVLTAYIANHFDKMIIERCQATAPISMNVVYPHPTLYVLETKEQLPDTYDQPLTEALVLQCIAYWQTQYSWSYQLSHTHFWFNDDKQPEFINYLIKVVNRQAFDEDHVMKSRCIPQLRQSLHDNKIGLFQMFESTDIAIQLKAALLRTSIFSNTKKSNIPFSELARLFNLTKSSMQTTKPAITPKVTQEDIQKKILELMKKYKEEHPSAPLNMFEIGEQARAMLQPAVNRPTSTITLYQVDATKLVRQNGLFSMNVFAESMTQIEKTLLHIRQKHLPHDDFFLDEDDIKILCHMLRQRWSRLLKQYDNDETAACECYTSKPNRSDGVYIALAEMLAKHERGKGISVYICSLLMPNSVQFATNRLKQSTLAPSMALELGVDSTISNIDDISLSKLIITRTGYALNIQSIIQAYEKHMTLINPYTQKTFINNELIDICLHPLAKELLKKIQENIIPRLTESALNLLVEYLNSAIFNEGFHNNYDAAQNTQAFWAYTKFNLALLKLPRSKREGLLQEPIPGSNDTVGSTFAKSETQGKSDSALGGGDMCLTLRGVDLARVVIAYKGKNHGLTNKKLIDRAISLTIPCKSYGLSKAPTTDLGMAEDYILNLFESGNLRYKYRRPK